MATHSAASRYASLVVGENVRSPVRAGVARAGVLLPDPVLAA
jgi:hypothetical protein